jgi:hypothetical protein
MVRSHLGNLPCRHGSDDEEGEESVYQPSRFDDFSRDRVLFRKLCEGSQDEKCQASLDTILKIRSVQDFSPSKAVGFIFLLKRAIGETLKHEIYKEPIIDEWLKFQSRIDDLALQAFDIYMGCREKICEIRVNQARAEKETAFKMIERMSKK